MNGTQNINPPICKLVASSKAIFCRSSCR
ncbi:unnamed protein product, partial [Adineta steineri]